MKLSSLRTIFCFLLVLHFGSDITALSAKETTPTIDKKRNQLIGYMIDKQLPLMHFSNKKVDDALAKDAFSLYLKQLDFQKRFLLKKDVDTLKSFAPYIDDDLARGSVTLPETGYEILGERLGQVEKMVEDILAHDLQVNVVEKMETDAEKLAYVQTLPELKERWRKIIKGQIISRYLELEEEQKKASNAKDEATLWKESLQKVAKQNKNFFHRLHQETLQDHYDRFFNAVARAFDPHTNYIPPAGKEQFDISMSGSLEGIGALLREDDGYIKVSRIIPGSASARQGRLQAEDIILQVAEGSEEPVDVTDMRLSDAVRLIRGPKGSEVRLTVRKADGAKDVIPIVRDVVQIEETFAKSMILQGPGNSRIGYLVIPSFYRDFKKNGMEGGRNSSDDTRKELEKLKNEKIDGLILDLRNNGGGALVDAVEIAGLFIDKGPVVQVKGEGGSERILNDEEAGEVYSGPMVILENKFSASASEIVVGAIQDYKRAIIVGDDHSHGKGTVQTVVDLNENIPLLKMRKYDDLGALKVTIQKFYRVTGNSTQFKGVEPDVLLPSMLRHIKSGEKYLEFALPWDSIAPVQYTLWPKKFDFDSLRKKSQERVQRDKGFQAIQEEAKHAEQRANDTLITLGINEMRKERENVRLAKEKVGAHYRKFRHTENSEDEDAPPPEDSKDEWMKDIQDDPYVRESMNILMDSI